MKNRHTSWATLLVLLCDALLLALALALGRAHSVAAQVAAVLTLLLALVHFYLVMHECGHGAVFAEQRYNEWLGHVLGFSIGCPFLTRRRSHALHHAWAGHPERDPTNARAIQRLSALSPRQLRVLDLLWRAYVPFLSLNERVGLVLAPFGRDRDVRGAARERRATCRCLVGYSLVLAALSACGQLRWLGLYALAWLLSLAVEELVNLPHHLHAPFTQQRLSPLQQGGVTHSCSQVPIWSRFVLLNFGLHDAHHRWPALPWSALPAAHRTLEVGQRSIVSNELVWSCIQRRQPFAKVLGQYVRAPQHGGQHDVVE